MDKYDAIIVGAGAAGLSAALALGRSLRKTLVLDGGAPRNIPSAHSHNFFTRDGVPPAELLEHGKRDLEKYETVEVWEGIATDATGTDGEFTVTLESGEEVAARKVLIASGVVDEMPEIPGFAEAWGRAIFHCPYCHGWEVRDQPIAIYGGGERLRHGMPLIRNLSRDLYIITDGTEGISDEDRERLDALGVPVYEGPISRVEMDEEAGRLTKVILDDGTELEREAIFANPPQRQRSEIAGALGCRIEYIEMMRTFSIVADPMTRETNIKGVFAAGDAGVPPAQSLSNSVATGTNAGAFINFSLAADDITAEVSSRERV